MISENYAYALQLILGFAALAGLVVSGAVSLVYATCIAVPRCVMKIHFLPSSLSLPVDRWRREGDASRGQTSPVASA